MNGSKILAAASGALFAACATIAGVSASAAPNPTASVAQRALAAHNVERDRVGVPRLKWNPTLARQAEEWGRSLARRGVLQHSGDDVRGGAGENLWMGTAGHWPVEAMIGMFVEEKRHFRPATFPNISRTGNWADVGHYTQLVWRDTREVGCAVATARGNDVLVCRYWPAGNVYGERAY